MTHCLAILWKWKALLGWLRGNTCAPVNQSRPKGKEVKVTGKKAEESTFTILLESRCQETTISVLLQPLCAWHSAQKLSCWGRMLLCLIHSMSLLSSHRSLHVSGTLMAFKCMTWAHTILVGLVLIWKEDKAETLSCSGSSYWGIVSSGAFGTHQRVTMARVPQLLPQHLPIGKESLWKRKSEEVEKRPQVPRTGHQKCHGLGAGWKIISRHEVEWEENKVY